jgi:hypothetical protein
MTDIQEAIDWAYAMQIIDADKTMSDYALKILAAAYREKCEEYNRLLEVAERIHRSLCAYIDHDLRGDDWYDAEVQASSFYRFKEAIK